MEPTSGGKHQLVRRWDEMASIDDVRAKLRVAQQYEHTAANWSNISYEMRAPIGAAALMQLELAEGIELPGGYRDFLLTVGNGGAGPGYGLFSFEQALAERGEGIYSLADPFEPPTSCRNWVGLRAPGMLPIYHDGCAFYGGLVVSGPDRGTVWSYVEVAPGWIPCCHDGYVGTDGEPFTMTGNDHADYEALYDALLLPENRARRQSFLERYLAWLDSVIAQAEAS